MTLPKRMESSGCKTHDGDCCECCPSEQRFKKGLAIAVEALQTIKVNLVAMRIADESLPLQARYAMENLGDIMEVEDSIKQAKDALRCIEEIGNGM